MASTNRPGHERITRRAFLKATAVSTAALGAWPGLAVGEDQAPKRSAIERVKLGHTKVQPTRLGFGTGSNGGQVQRALGADGLTKLVHYAYDKGVRYIDTADHYRIHGLVGAAIKGLPREELVLLTKMEWEAFPDVGKELDRLRKELGTDYFDIVLLHCMCETGWPEKMKKLAEGLAAAKEKGVARAIGVSSHGLPALKEVAACPWVDVALTRVNHKGHHMDGPTGQWAEPGQVEPVMAEVKKIHDAGKGVLGMKLVGNGDFKDADDREKAIQAVLKCPHVDAVTIGFKSAAEVDEAIERINRALKG